MVAARRGRHTAPLLKSSCSAPSTGIDDPAQLARLPQNDAAAIWTNEIEAIDRLMK
jgi:hypothetical protein